MSWKENALLIAIAGSAIAVVGQLAGTIIPIAYGPGDVSDFLISVDPVEATLHLYSDGNYSIDPTFWNVGVVDFHKHLRPYKFGVLLKIFDVPEGVALVFHHAEIQPGDVSRISFKKTGPSIYSLNGGEYHPITIQGIGGDGRKRNATFVLNVVNEYNRSS